MSLHKKATIVIYLVLQSTPTCVNEVAGYPVIAPKAERGPILRTARWQTPKLKYLKANGNGVDSARPGEGLTRVERELEKEGLRTWAAAASAAEDRKEAGKGRFKNMGSSSIGCGGQNSLEAESLRPNSPLGEWINDDDEDEQIEIYLAK